MDASVGENELVYGLKKLDKAIDFEKNVMSLRLIQKWRWSYQY